MANKVTRNRRGKGVKIEELFPSNPEWLELSQKAAKIVHFRNASDERELEILAKIDTIKIAKRLSIQSRRRCYYAKTKESLGDYWVPRHGPRCMSRKNPDHIRIPLRDCTPQHFEENFRKFENNQVM